MLLSFSSSFPFISLLHIGQEYLEEHFVIYKILFFILYLKLIEGKFKMCYIFLLSFEFSNWLLCKRTLYLSKFLCCVSASSWKVASRTASIIVSYMDRQEWLYLKNLPVCIISAEFRRQYSPLYSLPHKHILLF